jgi:hypothetical protein
MESNAFTFLYIFLGFSFVCTCFNFFLNFVWFVVVVSIMKLISFVIQSCVVCCFASLAFEFLKNVLSFLHISYFLLSILKKFGCCKCN